MRLFVLLFILVNAVCASDAWPMRWRVYCDTEAGITVRYPYRFYAPDQSKGELVEKERARLVAMEEREVVIEGKKVRMMVPMEVQPHLQLDVRIFSFLEKELPDEAKGKELSSVAQVLTNIKTAWTEYDYYTKHQARPFADKKWAAKEITAVRAGNEKNCAMVVKHAGRYSGVVVKGALSEEENEAILNSFEILQPGKGKNPSQSWRVGQTRLNKVINAQGAPISATAKISDIAWKECFEAETEHYHITANVAPAKLLYYAQYLEYIYTAFIDIYEPEKMPPYKLEIHIFETQADYMAAAASQRFDVGPTTAGFFAPQLMSIFVFAESGKLFGDDGAVEHVLAHECSHQFLHVACNGSRHVPTWLNEGLAVYFENGIVQGGRFVVRPPTGRIEILKQIYAQKRHTIMPIEQYLTHYGHIAPEQYSEVYAMTNFWLFGTCKSGCKHKPGDCGLAHFRDYWKRLQKKEDGTKAFEATFMAGMIKARGSRAAAISAWQKAYFDYVRDVLK
jgi:hypothetical protein